MNNWQDWVAALIALWCAWQVLRAFINPFVTRTCGGCGSGCAQPTKPLSPSPEEIISRHGFLQELTIDGACYTGADTFPEKMKDLLKPRLAIQVALRSHLDALDSKYRKKFEKEFGKSE